jgi:chromosome segregation ATPase
MQEISELERRIAAAFDRIDRGLEQADRARAAVVATPAAKVDPTQIDPSATDTAQIEAVLHSLEQAQANNADWAQRYAMLEAEMKDAKLSMADEIAKLTQELAMNSVDAMDPNVRPTLDQPEQLSQERLVLERQLSDLHGQLALQSAELTQLRAQRAAEIAELNAIVAALTPLMEEAKPYA